MTGTRNRVIVPVPSSIIGDLLRVGKHAWEVETDISKDATLVGTYYDPCMDCFCLTYEHPGLPAVWAGCQPEQRRAHVTVHGNDMAHCHRCGYFWSVAQLTPSTRDCPKCHANSDDRYHLRVEWDRSEYGSPDPWVGSFPTEPCRQRFMAVLLDATPRPIKIDAWESTD